jgi:hypothetical protein
MTTSCNDQTSQIIQLNELVNYFFESPDFVVWKLKYSIWTDYIHPVYAWRVSYALAMNDLVVGYDGRSDICIY